MKMDNKKKIVLVLTVCAFIFLAWQLYDLFGSKPVVREQALQKKAAIVHGALSSKKTVSRPTLAKVLPKRANQPVPVTQKKRYLSMVEQLEVYKLQREVLDQKLAIAKAQKAIAQVSLANRGFEPSSMSLTLHSNATPLRLSYIAFQGGQWVATVEISGRFQSVHTGDKLLDGSLVVAINESGIMLEKLGRKVALTFSGIARVRRHLVQKKTLPRAANIAKENISDPTVDHVNKTSDKL